MQLKEQTTLLPPREVEELAKRRPQFGLIALLLFIAALALLFAWFGWLYREGIFDWLPVLIVGALGGAFGLLRQSHGNKVYGCLIGVLLATYASAAMLTVVSIPELLLREGLAK
jgi:peptidoglycan/LPS O-acetylase OafA/YrhL